MKFICLFVLGIVITITSVGQKNNYRYSYRIKLPDIGSYCFINDFDKPVTMNKDSQLVRINFISADKLQSVIAYCKLILDNKDTVTLFADVNGYVEKKIPLCNFRLLVDMSFFSKLDYYISPTHQLTNIKAMLGRSFRLTIPILRSKKPLDQREIFQIIKKIATQGPEYFIKTENYYVEYEI